MLPGKRAKTIYIMYKRLVISEKRGASDLRDAWNAVDDLFRYPVPVADSSRCTMNYESLMMVVPDPDVIKKSSLNLTEHEAYHARKC